MAASGPCIYCGKEVSSGKQPYHDQCRLEYEEKRVGTATAAATSAAPPTAESYPAALIWLNILGFLALAIGLFFLLADPTEAPRTYLIEPGPRVINLHRAYIGQTFTIVGAVFLAAAWRPTSARHS